MNLSHQLHKLGAFAFLHPWRIAGGWLVALAILGFGAAQFYQEPSADIAIPGTQAQQTIDRLAEIFPDSGGESGRIVFHATNGKIADYKDEITQLVTEANSVAGISQAVSPFVDASFVSADGTIAYSQVQLDEQTGSVDPVTFDEVAQLVQANEATGLQIELGGGLVSQEPGEILGVGELVGVAIALIVLIVTLGSLIAGGMPLLSALTAIGASMAGLFALSQVVDINSTTPVLAIMLGLAVGIDYSLFIVNKYRTLVIGGASKKDAAGRALGTAGNAVVFAAFTVIIALAALSVVNIPFMTIMGLAGAASIAVAAIVSLTLTPALMGLAGDKIFTKKQRSKQAMKRAKKDITDHSNRWFSWGSAITNRPIPVLLAGLVVVGVIALPVTSLNLGLPTDQYAALETTERKAYDLLSEGFGVGFNAPLVVVVENLPQSPVPTENLTPMMQQQAKFASLGAVASEISKLDTVQQVQPALVSENGTSGLIQVIPTTAPSSEETKNLISTLRSQPIKNSDVTLAVTGTAALQDDINQKLADALPLYLVTIVGLSFVLLLIAFRSILVPIKATLGYVLSVLAMFGATVAVFQWGWFGIAEATGPIVSFVPIIAAGILFGLAMDYEFFLVSGMHEAYQETKDAKKSVVDGFGAGAKVVTAAAVIMVSVFAGFIFSSEAVIQSIGFGLAVGILVDAFVVRMTIVPAVMTLLGKSAWWLPKWLDKRVPHVSIEGETDK